MPITPLTREPLPYVRGGNLGELLQLQGRNAAQAELRRGDIQAEMWSRLGQQIAGGINSYAKERQEAPIRAQEAEARRIGLENARAEQAAGRKATEDASILASAKSMELDPDEIEGQLKQLGRGDLAGAFRKSWTEAEAAKVNLHAAKTKASEAEADYFGSLAAGVRPFLDQPDGGMSAVQMALQHAKAAGYDDADQLLGQIKDPSQIRQLVDGLIAKSPTYSKLVGEEADRALKTKQEQRAIDAAAAAKADKDADNKRLDATAVETARHNRATEANAAATDAAVPQLNPAGLDAAAKMYAQTGQLPAMGMGGKAANVRAAIINRAAELFPDLNIAANKAEYGATSGTLTQLQKQRGAIGAFEQTAQKNIDLFLAQAGKVVDTGSPLANTAARLVTGKMLGSPDQAAYDAARQVAINEIAKITSNPTLAGQLSDTARKEVEVFNPQNATLKQTVAVMKLLKQDMANRAQSLDDAIAQQRGALRGSASSASGTIRARDPQGNIHEAAAGTPLPKDWVAVP